MFAGNFFLQHFSASWGWKLLRDQFSKWFLLSIADDCANVRWVLADSREQLMSGEYFLRGRRVNESEVLVNTGKLLMVRLRREDGGKEESVWGIRWLWSFLSCFHGCWAHLLQRIWSIYLMILIDVPTFRWVNALNRVNISTNQFYEWMIDQPQPLWEKIHNWSGIDMGEFIQSCKILDVVPKIMNVVQCCSIVVDVTDTRCL